MLTRISIRMYCKKIGRRLRTRQRLKYLLLVLLAAVMICNISLQEPARNKTVVFLGCTDYMDLSFVQKTIEERLRNALLLDKGAGCKMPVLDPFAPEVYNKSAKIPTIECRGRDWVRCYLSKCRVIDDLAVKDVKCRIRDILYKTDNEYTFGPTTYIAGNEIYELKASDHIKVSCTGVSRKTDDPLKWRSNTVGFRPVQPKKSPPGRENSYNVLILAFDSTSRNGFIRRMPKSWKVLTEEMGAVVLESYNIVGDGTPAAMFPLLTGKTEFELPEARKGRIPYGTLDSFPFIFKKLREDGYRTAYLEEDPIYGTFQYRFHGWTKQPTDHYMRTFFLEKEADVSLLDRVLQKQQSLCMGDTPQYKLLINLTQQFMELSGKKFILTMFTGISHGDFDLIQVADDDTVAFLRATPRHAENTMLVVMGDHGTRYAKTRDTMQGQLEERLPLMAIVLPSRMHRERPDAFLALRNNVHTLSTPHDIHATILDVMGLMHYQNPYVVPGADYIRALSLLKPLPMDRSCSEAGVDPFWCACLSWQDVTPDDELYTRTGEALLSHINALIREAGEKCAPRTLSAISWVKRQQPARGQYLFQPLTDELQETYKKAMNKSSQNYQIKMEVGPGKALFEAMLEYNKERDQLAVDSRHISRINAYGLEPQCLSETHRDLNKFCYCLQQT